MVSMLHTLEDSEKEVEITTTSTEYPRLVMGEKFGIFKRIMARFSISHVDGQIYLGYCKTHKKYYLDLIHMHEDIRCPICDTKWLLERDIINRTFVSSDDEL